jgi:hypothetical protein
MIQIHFHLIRQPSINSYSCRVLPYLAMSCLAHCKRGAACKGGATAKVWHLPWVAIPWASDPAPAVTWADMADGIFTFGTVKSFEH